MTLAEKIERLVRHLPGVAGYQDRETSRSTDKVVRQRLSAELDEMVREIERVKAKCVDDKDLSSLALLDRLSTKLDRLSQTVMYASYGYGGLFDVSKFGSDGLAQLYAFDLGLLDELEAVRVKAGELRQGGEVLREAAVESERLLDVFEKTFMSRQTIIEGG
ncbi:MAG: hypothetical protein ACM3ON_14025 [Chloroflexota bacterium]